MTKLKYEIEKAVGKTKKHKENVWTKLQQPLRKNRLPIIVTFATIAIACILFAIVLLPTNNQQTANDPSNNDIVHLGYPFTVLHKQESIPGYIENEEAILLAINEHELQQLAKDYKIATPAVNFDKYFVVFAQYISDGCGLVVDKVDSADDTLLITLDLPLELRNDNTIACTSIARKNLSVILLEKFQGYSQFKAAQFTNSNIGANLDFNTLNKNELMYDFELLMDPYTIESLIVKNLQSGSEKPITDEHTKVQLSSIIHEFKAVPGIADIVDPQYELVVEDKNGEVLRISLWMDEENEHVTIQSTRNTHQIYSLTGEQAAPLLKLKE